MSATNKALVLEAFDTLFNRRDYATAERFWSTAYIQRSAHIAPGRAGLFDLVRASVGTLRYQHGVTLAEGDFVIVMAASPSPAGRPLGSRHSARRGHRLAEHRDVLQDEATSHSSVGGQPMFGAAFPDRK